MSTSAPIPVKPPRAFVKFASFRRVCAALASALGVRGDGFDVHDMPAGGRLLIDQTGNASGEDFFPFKVRATANGVYVAPGIIACAGRQWLLGDESFSAGKILLVYISLSIEPAGNELDPAHPEAEWHHIMASNTPDLRIVGTFPSFNSFPTPPRIEYQASSPWRSFTSGTVEIPIACSEDGRITQLVSGNVQVLAHSNGSVQCQVL